METETWRLVDKMEGRITPSTVPVIDVHVRRNADGEFQGIVNAKEWHIVVSEINQQRAALSQPPLDIECPAESFSSTVSLVGDTGSGA